MNHHDGTKRRLNLLVWTALLSIVSLFLYVAYLLINASTEKNKTVDLVTVLQSNLVVEIKSTYKFHPSDGVSYKEIKNVGLTYYSRGDGYTPGTTTRSGRFVYDGVVAVSQPMWQKEVWPGDLIWVKATGRWYKVEDTMHEKYKEARIDIYTHEMAVANSGSSKTDIIIVRQPK